MKMGNKPHRFFFRSEKVAVFESVTERQTGTNKKSPGVLLFNVSKNQYRLMLDKSVLYQNLITDHKAPCNTTGKSRGAMRLDRNRGGLLTKGARFAFCVVFAGKADNTRREQGRQQADHLIHGFRHGKPQGPGKAAEGDRRDFRKLRRIEQLFIVGIHFVHPLKTRFETGRIWPELGKP
jgi:hypothetical protein